MHEALLPKLNVMKTFLFVMRDSSLECIGLGLHYVDIDSIAQADNLFVCFYTADATTQSLLTVASECVQLELSIAESFFMLQHADVSELVKTSWVVSLWKGLCQFNIQIRLSQDIMKSSKQ